MFDLQVLMMETGMTSPTAVMFALHVLVIVTEPTSPPAMFYFQVLMMVSGETGLTSPPVLLHVEEGPVKDPEFVKVLMVFVMAKIQSH